MDIGILKPEANSQKGPQNIDKICVISCVQHVVLKWAHGPYICSSHIKAGAPIFCSCYAETLFAKTKLSFLIFSGNLLLRENPFYTTNCLKSFDFKLFFVYALIVEGLFGKFILKNI